MADKNVESEDDLPKLSAPARRALLSIGCTRLDQVAQHSETEIKRLHGMGPNALNQLRSALTEKGFSFADGKSSTPNG